MATGKAEKLFREFGRKIDELGSKIMDSETIKELEVEERLEELKKSKDQLAKELRQLTDENKGAVKEIIDDIDEAFEKLRNGVKETFRKHKGSE